jgi:predicted anti-sigma-YlaC factor YlaD
MTEQEFTDLLIGVPVHAGVQEHVANCRDCAERLDVFEGAVHEFSSASLRWIEARPTTSLREVARQSARRATQVRYGWAVSGLVTVLLAIPIWTHTHRNVGGMQNEVGLANQAGVENSQAQIARDNELLKSVDVALSDAGPWPLQQFGMDTGNETPDGLSTGSRSE